MRTANITGFYELNDFPGCSQLVVSNNAFIFPKYRGKGNGGRQHKARLQHAKKLGYDAIICTVDSKNKVERHILRKNKWHRQARFTSKKTGHLVEIWFRLL